MDARTRARQLAGIRAGRSYLWWSRRGWLIVGPTAVLERAAASRPRETLAVTGQSGHTATVRIVRVVGQFRRGGVDYATAVFTKLPQARRWASRKTRNPTKESHMFTKLIAFLTAAGSWCHRCGHAAPDKKCLCPDCGCGLYS
jgi:hypothetical protein